VTPEYSGTVLVLNGTTTAGVAGKGASTLAGAGFTTSTNDAPSVQSKTAVYYNGDSAAKAAGVAKSLGLSVTPVANDGNWDGSVDVVVVFGTDWTSGTATSTGTTSTTTTGTTGTSTGN
jgi:hypothetical protein